MTAHSEHLAAIETAWSKADELRGLVLICIRDHLIDLKPALMEAMGDDRPASRETLGLADAVLDNLEKAQTGIAQIQNELSAYRNRM